MANKVDVGEAGVCSVISPRNTAPASWGAAARRRRLGGWATVAPATLYVVATMIVPLLLLLGYSFLRFVPGKITDYTLTTDNYSRLLGDWFYLKVIGQTAQVALEVTLVTLVAAFPIAYFLARTTSRYKAVLTYLVFLPLMVGIVVRAYGWMIILGREGLINSTFLGMGIISAPLNLLFTPFAVILGLVEVSLPFMIMPLMASLEKIDPHVAEASRALGATPFQTFTRVTLPLSMPGIVSGCLLVFSMSLTAYAVPALLGGPKVKMISGFAYDAMLVGYNWPFGAAIGLFMAVLSGLIVYGYLRSTMRGDQ